MLRQSRRKVLSKRESRRERLKWEILWTVAHACGPVPVPILASVVGAAPRTVRRYVCTLLDFGMLAEVGLVGPSGRPARGYYLPPPKALEYNKALEKWGLRPVRIL
jgi:hypothetical protein